MRRSFPDLYDVRGGVPSLWARPELKLPGYQEAPRERGWREGLGAPFQAGFSRRFLVARTFRGCESTRKSLCHWRSLAVIARPGLPNIRPNIGILSQPLNPPATFERTPLRGLPSPARGFSLL